MSILEKNGMTFMMEITMLIKKLLTTLEKTTLIILLNI